NQDLAVTNRFSNNVSILSGDGAGNFSGPVNFPTGAAPWPLSAGDFNGDSNEDLVIGNTDSNRVSILLGDGMGQFNAPTNFTVATSPQSVAVGDFNCDGKQDIAIVNEHPNTLSILLRDCALTPTGVVSRKTHGNAGSFDIDLPLAGSPGIECRAAGGTNDYTMIATFSGNVSVTGNPQAQVTLGTGTIGSGGVGNGGMVTINGNTVIIPLTNVASVQTINVTLFGVNGIGNVVIPMSVLVGDANGNGVVNAADVAQTKSRIGQAVDQTSFRSDVNADGNLNASDVAIIKSRAGTGLP
ncbi:MAG: FG-GAP-like repeat-containing protein, partial [Bryobacteraceae bacterium]